MANKGKRMVSEDLIKQIGQGGGGSEYTAGTGISISDEDVISADTTVMATNNYAQATAEFAVSNGAIKVDKTRYFVDLPGDYNGDMAAWFADIPVLQTNGFTDAETFGHPVINGDQNAQGYEYLDLAGTYIIRDTANNTNQLITTYSINTIYAEDTASAKTSQLRHYLCFRTGNNDWGCQWTRHAGSVEFRYMDSEQQVQVYATAIKLTRSIYFGTTAFNANGVSGQSVDIRIGKLKPNYNAAVAIPTTEGKYMLKVGVNNNGEVDQVSWIDSVDQKVIKTIGLEADLSQFSTLEELFTAGCPIIECDNTETVYTNNVVPLEIGEVFYVKGIFALKGNGTTQQYNIFVSNGRGDGDASGGKAIKALAIKSAKKDVTVYANRYRASLSAFDSCPVNTIVNAAGSDLRITGGTAGGTSGVAALNLFVGVTAPEANVRYDNQLMFNNTTDGTYVLEATVSNGTLTYAWVLKA